MKRIRLIALVLVAAGALSGVAAPASHAVVCALVAEPGTGHFGDNKCRSLSGVKNWTKIKSVQLPGNGFIFCARVNLGEGTFTNEGCKLPGAGEFIKINLLGGFWQVGGTKLNQGSKGISLQSKGNLVLKGEISTAKITITCETSTGLGTIDGQGEVKQGQGKGTVTYETCKAELSGGSCEVEKTLKTNQLKSHLVLATVQGETQMAELFEPTGAQETKPTFIKITLKNCGVLNGPHEVTGSVVGSIQPQEEEAQEGALSFPITPIEEAIHEGQAIKTGLKFGPNPATFSGYYSSKLQNGAPFGAFLS